VLDRSRPPFYRWFRGGHGQYLPQTRLDRHAECPGAAARRPALIYDSPVAGTQRRFTYTELRDDVARRRGRDAGLRRQDRLTAC